MEDLLELVVALLVIVVPLISKRAKKKQQKPGNPQAAKPQKQAKPPKKPEKQISIFDEDEMETLSEIGNKIDKWMDDMEAKAAAKKKTAHSEMEPQRLFAERLEPEPLIPQSMLSTPLEEAGMREGDSHADEAGCIGGSLPHSPDEHHQGQDFHSHGTHGYSRPQRQAEPIAVQRVKPAVSAAELRKAVIWSEVLDKPVSLRNH